MSFAAALRAAWRALSTNLLRSMLTMLGIIIGVAAVITMIAIGTGAQQRVEQEIRALGTNVMLVFSGSQATAGLRLGAQTGQNLTEEDAQAIAVEVPEVQAAAPSSRRSAQVILGNVNWATSIVGTNSNFLEVRDWTLSSGRAFEPEEISGSGKVAILGQTVVKELFGDEDPIDQTIRVQRVPVKVIGVLSAKGQNSSGTDQDDIVLVPISTFRNRIDGRVRGKLKRVGAIFVKVYEGQSMAAAEEGVRELLRQRLKVQEGVPDNFTVRNLTEVLKAQEDSSRVFGLLLAAVAGVSLLVGGIGIMNIMLVSVTERTREIGLRLAVGARGRDILRQFLIEAVTLSVMGGALGVLLGAGATWAVAEFAQWQVVLSTQAVLLAVGFSAAVGVFFGYYPARRAAALLPIQALRHE
jgi:putative ABC transport system permease protein